MEHGNIIIITIIISWNMVINKSTISMVIFNSYVTMLVYQRVSWNMVINNNNDFMEHGNK